MIDWLKCKILLKWSLDSENGGKKVLRLLFYPLGSEALDFIRKIYFRNFAVGEGQTTAECFVFPLYNQKTVKSRYTVYTELYGFILADQKAID